MKLREYLRQTKEQIIKDRAEEEGERDEPEVEVLADQELY